MRIGIFSESYEPVLNGVTVSILTLLRELKESGHEIFVFAPRWQGHTDVEYTVVRFPSVCTPKAPDYPLAIPYLPRITSKVRDLDLDLIHTHTPFMLGCLGLKLARRLNIPVVSTNHTLYAEYAHYVPIAPLGVTRAVIVGHLRRYYNRCKSVIVPSGPAAERLIEYGVRTPVHVVPTGISLNTARDQRARTEVRERCGIPADARTLLYVGRLAREKNLELLFESFDRLARKHPDIYLLMVGGGPYEVACNNLARKLHCSERVVFTGFVPRDDVARFYSAGDLFTFPSTTETQGLVICEAMGAGLPCVAVRAGGSQEMVVDGEDGLLAENSIDSFMGKIDMLLTDRRTMEQFSARAVENAARFSPREMGRNMLKIYESVLSADTNSGDRAGVNSQI